MDDSPSFLELARRFLDGEPAVEVVGAVNSGRAAVEAVPKLEPDLVLMDLAMPEMNGLEATRLIKAAANPPRVIILTLYGAGAYGEAARAVGADGLVVKADLIGGLGPAIRSACAALDEPRPACRVGECGPRRS